MITNDTIKSDGVRSNVAEFKPGDTVRVSYRVIEGNRERIQNFEGLCIQRKGEGIGETFTVRKNSFGVPVERVFPLHSPKIAGDRKSTRLNSSHANISYAVFCLKKKRIYA